MNTMLFKAIKWLRTALLIPALIGGPGAAAETPQAQEVEAPQAQEAETPAGKRPLKVELLWSGSWDEGGKLSNRGDLRLHFAGPGLSLRGEMLDRRDGDLSAMADKSFWDEGETAFLGGIYHQGSYSRILYGPLEEWGLVSRLRNPWSRGLPFTESRKASMAELRTSPSGKEEDLYVYLGTPYLGLGGLAPKAEGLRLRGFAAARINPGRIAGGEDSPPLGEGTALNAGLEGRLGKAASLTLEGLYTAGALQVSNPSAWFSADPFLPERDFTLYGLALLFNSPYFSLSADGAWSDIPAFGQDIYANLGFRAGNRKAGRGWQLSLAADGAGPHYAGSDGTIPGAGFRTGGKFEWQGRAGFVRVNTGLSGPGFRRSAGGDLGLDFNRSSSGLYYRPPPAALPLRLSRISVTADRDGREDDHIRDSLGLSLSLAASPQGIIRAIRGRRAGEAGNAEADNVEGGSAGTGKPAAKSAGPEGTLALNLSGALSGSPAAGWGEMPGRDRPPWPIPEGPYRLESFKAGAQLSWSRPVNLPVIGWFKAQGGRGNLQLKAGLDYSMSITGAGEEEAVTKRRDLSLSAVLRGKRSRFTVKLNYPDLPSNPFEAETSIRDAWELSLSWKLEWK
ncbi:MAG: hypothetical protein LBQ46_09585 [Treponema sp.]|jgi:hypothetical protein|nr:hypothetical protein [Treponema sp.]